MENGYDKIATYVVLPIVVAGVALFALYQFAIHILPWLILAAVVIAAVFFFFWQRSTRRSAHPWD